jgi:RecB family exonuclease
MRLAGSNLDRLDLSGDGSRARVIDYKTGKPKATMAENRRRGVARLELVGSGCSAIPSFQR